ncbi:MAG TPA: hypothetical protein VGK20_12960 [Candidatus Binatia bacterium]|jgi:hypothetical protein
MKTFHLSALALAAIAAAGAILPVAASNAQVHVEVGISLPTLAFAAPPQLVVLPDTYVYAVPDLAEDLYFVDGWWWRPWQGHWYRSHYYDRGWDAYSSVPAFYGGVPHDWRDSYRSHQWRGQPWNYERMPYSHVEQNWNSWKSTRYWDSHRTWGSQQDAQSQRHGEEHGMQMQHPGHGSPAYPSQHHEQRSETVQSEQHRNQTRAAQPQHHEQQAPAGHSQQRSPAAQPQHHQQPQHAQQHRSEQPYRHGHESEGHSQPAHESGGGGRPNGSGNSGEH